MTPDPAARRPLKSRDSPFFKALAARLAAAGISPNAISFFSIVFGAAAGLALARTPHAPDEWRLAGWWLAAAGCIQLRLIANLLDGMVAVEGRRGGPTGDLWNEAPDRVADTAIMVGAGFAAGCHPWLGFGAAIVALFVAYIRALGASVGAGQCFLGPQAKPHRMAVLTLACVLNAIWALVPRFSATVDWPVLPVIAIALWVVILGGLVTAWRRLNFLARFLRQRAA